MSNSISKSNSVITVNCSDTESSYQTTTQKSHWDFLWPFVCLLFVEIITFGINAKRIGIYQDEWIYFDSLHFSSSQLIEAIATSFFDPRIIVRPIEALHYGPLFFFVHENPFWYHFVCYFFEFLSGWFLFLTIIRLSKNKAVALTTAILFLLYPTHDATHYEIVASSLPISMAFFTLSLWLYLKGLDENRYALILWSGLAYLISIYNYEFCLPLY